MAVPFIDAKSLSKLSVMVYHGSPSPSAPSGVDAPVARVRRRRAWYRVQMGKVGNLIGTEGAPTAGVVGPPNTPGSKKAIDNQLGAALEQIERLTCAGSVNLYFSTVIHGIRRRSAASVTGAVKAFSFTGELLARSLPLGTTPSGGVFIARCPSRSLSLLVSLFACCHLVSLCFLKRAETIRSENFLNLPMHNARILPWIQLRRPLLPCFDACWAHLPLSPFVPFSMAPGVWLSCDIFTAGASKQWE